MCESLCLSSESRGAMVVMVYGGKSGTSMESLAVGASSILYEGWISVTTACTRLLSSIRPVRVSPVSRVVRSPVEISLGGGWRIW